MQDLLDEATQAAESLNTRRCYQLIDKVAYKPAAAMVTVNNTDGKPCMTAEEESRVRIEALKGIFQAQELDMATRPAVLPLPAFLPSSLDTIFHAVQICKTLR